MSAYEEFRFDPERCRLELEEFERLLMERPELSERADILPFFRTRRHLAALLGSYNPNANVYDRLAIELSLFGEFTADVSAGDSSKNAFCLIEFEDGKPNSILPSVAAGRASGPVGSNAASARSSIGFGSWTINVVAVLIIGRESGLADEDRARLMWRREHVVVNSRHVHCCTFDELARDLRQRLDRFPRATGAE